MTEQERAARDIKIIVKKLRTLDPEAADYVQHKYDIGDLESYNISNTPTAITMLFTWSHQPQGSDYWSKLYYDYMLLPNKIITAKGNEL